MTIREEVDAICKARLGRTPNLENPTGYNDKIQWLKIFDQTPDHIIACDKFACRELVARRAGEAVLVPLIYEGTRFRAIRHFPQMVKASHDSGSALKVSGPGDFAKAAQGMSIALGRPYGHGKGEWAYRLISPRRVLIEECLPGPIVDYKFHCSGGAVRWIQVISERGAKGGPAESIFMPDGTLTDLHMDHKMRHVPNADLIPGDFALSVLTDLAEVLASGWRYVRVDLYWVHERPYFGELTFWPLAGCYKTADEPKFGELLELDLSNPSAPIVP